MATIDFITAFGRLLRDGALRDAFVLNPDLVATQLNVREEERPALQQLNPNDLEFQAHVLLRKRLDIVRRVIPETCRRLAVDEWPIFYEYARHIWPEETDSLARDAFNFCLYLKRKKIKSVNKREWNRLQFAFGERRLTASFIGRETSRGSSRPSLQILFRTRQEHWHEIIVSVGF